MNFRLISYKFHPWAMLFKYTNFIVIFIPILLGLYPEFSYAENNVIKQVSKEEAISFLTELNNKTNEYYGVKSDNKNRWSQQFSIDNTGNIIISITHGVDKLNEQTSSFFLGDIDRNSIFWCCRGIDNDSDDANSIQLYCNNNKGCIINSDFPQTEMELGYLSHPSSLSFCGS